MGLFDYEHQSPRNEKGIQPLFSPIFSICCALDGPPCTPVVVQQCSPLRVSLFYILAQCSKVCPTPVLKRKPLRELSVDVRQIFTSILFTLSAKRLRFQFFDPWPRDPSPSQPPIQNLVLVRASFSTGDAPCVVCARCTRNHVHRYPVRPFNSVNILFILKPIDRQELNLFSDPRFLLFVVPQLHTL